MPTGSLLIESCVLFGNDDGPNGTADQFFSESQFESYRMLDAHDGPAVFRVPRRFSLLHSRHPRAALKDETV